MTDRTVVITGASSGIGLETALALGKRGARLLLLGRHPGRCKAAAARIEAAAGRAPLDFLAADLSSLSEVRAAATRILERIDRIDVLIHNAGAIFRNRLLSADGLEMHFALNHLGPFLLNHLLTPLVLQGAPARILVVSSVAHTRGRFDFEDLNLEKNYQVSAAYARSKLANLLFARELARRLSNRSVTVNALHPGIVSTRFGRNGNFLRFWARRLLKGGEISPAEGAQTLIYLATAPEVAAVTGAYFFEKRAIEPAPQATDAASAARLWELSERLTGCGPGH